LSQSLAAAKFADSIVSIVMATIADKKGSIEWAPSSNPHRDSTENHACRESGRRSRTILRERAP
jgi:hypothetical protein